MTREHGALRHRLRHSASVQKESNSPEVLYRIPLICGPSRPRNLGSSIGIVGRALQKCKIFEYGPDSRAAARIQSGEVNFMPDPINPPTSADRPNPNEKLVKVFDSELESEAIVVKGLLDSAGVDSDLTAASMVQDTFPGLGGMIILVREEDADAARKVIAEHQPLSEDEDTAEIEVNEEPPQKP